MKFRDVYITMRYDLCLIKMADKTQSEYNNKQ